MITQTKCRVDVRSEAPDIVGVLPTYPSGWLSVGTLFEGGGGEGVGTIPWTDQAEVLGDCDWVMARQS
jgi:hypothetical protein